MNQTKQKTKKERKKKSKQTKQTKNNPQHINRQCISFGAADMHIHYS